VEEASRDVANRFRSPEADVNALGYRMLRSGRVSVAIAVFRLNTRVFPMSANVWDSLGEALLAADRRDEAIASYRRALEIDPEFASATQALERLGVQ
jgi:Flp pilus assembly protein TadD